MTATMERSQSSEDPTLLTSLPGRLRSIAQRDANRVALREKEFGIWNETTYGEYWQEVQAAAMAFYDLGVRAGDKVAIQSENRKAWVISDLAIQALHAVSVGLYPTNPTSEVEYLLNHSESKILIAEDQEQVDKALGIPSLTHLEKIVYVEPRGVRTYDDPRLMSWTDFLAAGMASLETDPNRITELVDRIDPESTATLVYTSGTTRPTKGSHAVASEPRVDVGLCQRHYFGGGLQQGTAPVVELSPFVPCLRPFVRRLWSACYGLMRQLCRIHRHGRC